MSSPTRMRRRGIALATAVAALTAVGAASAATSFDVQANSPQVQGSPTSDSTAVFPTNKQNETTVAVNPLAPGRLIAGSNDEQRQPACGPGAIRGADALLSDCSFFPLVGTDGVYTSSDGGATWTNRGLLDDQASWKASNFVSDGDPVIVYGPQPLPGGGFSTTRKRAYYVGLASEKVGSYAPGKAPEFISVSYSDDDGATWSAPVLATTKQNPNTFNDKNSAWVDDNPASRYYGNLYVGFTAFRSATATGNGNAPVMVSRSTDGGRSFGPPNQLSAAQNNASRGGRQGTDITTGPDGTVYVAWEDGGSQVVAVSTDGGTTYSRPIAIGPVTDIQDPIPGANFRTDSFPNIGADPRSGSTVVYASWTTRTVSGGRVVVYRSTNRGRSWALDGTVSGSGQGYAFFDALSVAPSGRVDVGFQGLTARDATTFGTGNAAIDAYYASRSAATGGWSAPIRVNSASSDPAASAQNNLERQFWGDYNTITSTDARAWFIFTDSRNGAGCAAVDGYQRVLSSLGLAENEDRDAPDAEAPADPDRPAKPAPPSVCPGQFGNSDAWVAVITP